MQQPDYLAFCDRDEVLPLAVAASPIYVSGAGLWIGGVDVVFAAVSFPAAALALFAAIVVVEPARKAAAKRQMSLRQGSRLVQSAQAVAYATTFALSAYFCDAVTRDYIVPENQLQEQGHVLTQSAQRAAPAVHRFRPHLKLSS